MNYSINYKFNKSIIIYDHNAYVLLYNSASERTYRVSPIEYKILCMYISNQAKDNLYVFERENVKNLIENAKKEKIIINCGDEDIPSRRLVKRIVLKAEKGCDEGVFSKKAGIVIEWLERLSIVIIAILFIYSILNKKVYRYIMSSLMSLLLSPGILALLYVLIMGTSLVIHELSHMLVSKAKGADVPEIGIRHIGPFFWLYTRIINLDKMTDLDKIIIYYAGCTSNIYLFAFFWLLLPRFYSNRVIFSFIFVGATVNLSLYLFNMLPFLKLDGQKILLCEINASEMCDINHTMKRRDIPIGVILFLKGILIAVCLLICFIYRTLL